MTGGICAEQEDRTMTNITDADVLSWLRGVDGANGGFGSSPTARAALKLIERQQLAVGMTIEACARLVEQIGDPDDESEIGEVASQAFNELDRQPMATRLEAWNKVIAAAIRALAHETAK